MSSIFQYKPCSYPPSLFDSSLVLLKPQKPIFAAAIWPKLRSDSTGSEGELQYVLDGGALFHRIPWPQGFQKYREIYDHDKFCLYVTGKYGAAVVVFEGYKQSSTKDIHTRGELEEKPRHLSHSRMTWNWPGRKTTSCLIQATSNSFINMLSRYLQKFGCQTHHSQTDADLLIVQKRKSARRANTVLVRDNTDLLCAIIQKWARKNFFFSLSQGHIQQNDVSGT